MILPLITYSSVANNINVEGMRIVKRILRKACKCILRPIDNKFALLSLNIFPVPFYLQLLELLFFAKVQFGYCDFSFGKLKYFAAGSIT